ncbi:MAG: hypothetical protein KKE23_01875, partial [Nanoarchaeota archaeon]|nr:hypothetical protein [Nanoarchaeota archaeon]
MAEAENNTKGDEYLFIGIVLAVLMAKVYPTIQPYLLYFQNLESKISSFISLLSNGFHSHQFYSIIITGVVLLAIYAVYKAISKIIKVFQDKKYRKGRLKEEKESIKELLRKDVNTLKDEEIIEMIHDLKYQLFLMKEFKGLREYKKRLSLQLCKAEWVIEKKEHEKELWKRECEKMAINEEIERLEKEKMWKKMTEEQVKTQIAMEFLRDGEDAVPIKRLSKKEIDALVENDYSKVNEY